MSDDRRWLRDAIELAGLCPPSSTAYSVGAVLVAGEDVLATGFSREAGMADHAEERALQKVDPGDARLASATMYTSLEPCSTRASRPQSCTQLILDAGIPRVVFAWREPNLFVDCQGAELLRRAGVEVVEIPHFAGAAQEPNRHLTAS